MNRAVQNGGQETFTYRSSVARYALTDPPAGVEISTTSFNTTEIHCTEYFAGTTAGDGPASSFCKQNTSSLSVARTQ